MVKPDRMPVLFVGHGSPTNAIEKNEFSTAWKKFGANFSRPKAILSISAHWQTFEPAVTGSELPQTIHDFWGFPQELFDVQYPAPGSEWLVNRVSDLVDNVAVDLNWGLDHGTWSVLHAMYPKADIPVVQFSLSRGATPAAHYELGKALNPLRDEGVLIFGSGNVVHNLRMTEFQDVAYDWAVDFDQQVRGWIMNRQDEELVNFKKHGKAAELAINSAEHYLPLLYILGASTPEENIQFYCEKVTLGSISMRCVQIG